MFAVRMRLGQSRSGPASTCIEDLRVRTSSVAARSTRPPRSYRVRHQIWELWLPPQERRGLCQAPDTRMWLNAQKVEVETSSVFARKHTVGKLDCLAFQRTNPRLLNPTRRPSGPLQRPDLESRSATSVTSSDHRSRSSVASENRVLAVSAISRLALCAGCSWIDVL